MAGGKMSEKTPIGEERQIESLNTAAIDGAPITYLIVLASIVVALSFFPMSVIIAIGGSFPMSQGVLGLVGWILGPIAGPIASSIGAVIGIFVAPHTAGIPFIRIWGSILTSFAAGTMVLGTKRKRWWLWVWVYAILSFIYFAFRALVINKVGIVPFISNTFVDWSALILFALPTRTIFARWINSKNWVLVLLGLGFGTWMTFGLTHVCLAAITYQMFNWTEEVFIGLIPIIPFENLMRVTIGVVIGSGVIAGLRSIGLVKPEEAIY
jgi:hypothetical protein